MAIFTYQQYIAYQLAHQLDDKKHFGFYCVMAKRYSPLLLFQTLRDCEQLKNWPKIKNKGAYYTKTLFYKIEKYQNFILQN